MRTALKFFFNQTTPLSIKLCVRNFQYESVRMCQYENKILTTSDKSGEILICRFFYRLPSTISDCYFRLPQLF